MASKVIMRHSGRPEAKRFGLGTFILIQSSRHKESLAYDLRFWINPDQMWLEVLKQKERIGYIQLYWNSFI